MGFSGNKENGTISKSLDTIPGSHTVNRQDSIKNLTGDSFKSIEKQKYLRPSLEEEYIVYSAMAYLV